jgi:hypothetical protein
LAKIRRVCFALAVTPARIGKKQKAPSQRKLIRGKDFHQEALVGVEPTMADLQSGIEGRKR